MKKLLFKIRIRVGFRTDHLRGQFIGALMREEETIKKNELEKNENEH